MTAATITPFRFPQYVEIKKPESYDPGSVLAVKPKNAIPSLQPKAISCNGKAMATTGFIKIPRSILEHPTFISAPLTYRWVLITIMQHAAFSVCQQDDHGTLVTLQPGQFLTTERELAKLAGVPRSTVTRCLARFSHVQILGQKVNQSKTIITIFNLDTCDVPKKKSEPNSEPRSNQDRTIKEEYKNIRTTPSESEVVVAKKKPSIPKVPSDPNVNGQIRKTIEVAIQVDFPFPPARLSQLCRKFSVKAVREVIKLFHAEKWVDEDADRLKGKIYNEIKSHHEYITEILC